MQTFVRISLSVIMTSIYSQKHAILGDIQGKLNSECVNGDQGKFKNH